MGIEEYLSILTSVLFCMLQVFHNLKTLQKDLIKFCCKIYPERTKVLAWGRDGLAGEG